MYLRLQECCDLRTRSCTCCVAHRAVFSLLLLLQEFCDLGTLRDYVVVRLGLPARLKAGEPEAMARLLQLLHDAATGLVALHAAKVVHGDLVSTLPAACGQLHGTKTEQQLQVPLQGCDEAAVQPLRLSTLAFRYTFKPC